QPHLIYQARTRAYNVTAFNRMWQMRRHAVNTLVGANFAAKKDKLLQYDISYGTCTEDLELCWYLQEMGEHVKVATDVRSSSRIPSSFGNYYSQIKRWNKGKLEALWLHKKDIFKNPGLAFTTVLPSIAGSYLSAVYRYSLPVIAFYDPWLATALITFEIMESSIITGMLSPKNLFQFPAYFLQAYAMSTSYLHAGAEVTMDILRGETHKWNKSKWNRPNLMEQNNGEVYLFDKKAN
ncbi:MAG: glycosyltransferase family 2 protein, partial [Candidatus Woesearchaeota archaeon]|nr:glycosyltransferase family 2 protein [Candidatus Woesearchaeota archaeon]